MAASASRATSCAKATSSRRAASSSSFAARPPPTAPSSATIDAERSREPFGLRTLLPELAESTPRSRASRAAAPSRCSSSAQPARAKRSSRARCTSVRPSGGPFVAGQLRRAPGGSRREPPLRTREGRLLRRRARRDRLRPLGRRRDALPRRDRRPPADVAGGAPARVLQERRGHPRGRDARHESRRPRHRRDPPPARGALGGERGAFRSDLLARLKGYTHRLPSLPSACRGLRRHLRRRARPGCGRSRAYTPDAHSRGGARAPALRMAAQHPGASPSHGERRRTRDRATSSTRSTSLRSFRRRRSPPRASRRTRRPTTPCAIASWRSCTSIEGTSPRWRAPWARRPPRSTGGCAGLSSTPTHTGPPDLPGRSLTPHSHPSRHGAPVRRSVPLPQLDHPGAANHPRGLQARSALARE